VLQVGATDDAQLPLLRYWWGRAGVAV